MCIFGVSERSTNIARTMPYHELLAHKGKVPSDSMVLLAELFIGQSCISSWGTFVSWHRCTHAMSHRCFRCLEHPCAIQVHSSIGVVKEHLFRLHTSTSEVEGFTPLGPQNDLQGQLRHARSSEVLPFGARSVISTVGCCNVERAGYVRRGLAVLTIKFYVHHRLSYALLSPTVNYDAFLVHVPHLQLVHHGLPSFL